jgi:hypothetical protein
MPYANDALYRLGGTARSVGVLMLVFSSGIFLLATNHRDTRPRDLVLIAAFGMLPPALMIALSFPVRRGRIWAACAMLAACALQLPTMLLFSAACYGQIFIAYFVARCLIAWPEIRFQLRAARRTHGDQRRSRANAAAAAQTPERRPVIQPPPKSLKPRTPPPPESAL